MGDGGVEKIAEYPNRALLLGCGLQLNVLAAVTGPPWWRRILSESRFAPQRAEAGVGAVMS